MINEKKPSVLVVIERFFPLVGGAETQCLQICLGLKRMGYDLSVIMKKWHQEFSSEEYLGIEKLLVKRLGFPGFSRMADYLSGLSLIKYLIFHQKDFQVLFVDSGIANIFASSAILVGRILNKKVIIKVETPGELIFSGPHALSPKKFVHPFIKFRVFMAKKGDFYIAQTEEMKEELVSLGIKRNIIWSFPNSVDENLFKPPANNVEKIGLRQKLALPKEKVIVMFCGRLVARKGLIFLLEAWKNVVKKTNKRILILVGSGQNQPDSAEKELKGFVKENFLSDSVIFAGEKNKSEVVDYLKSADIFVHPSIHPEGRSLSVLEAMSCRLPVIVSNVGGLKEIVTGNINGILVKKEDSLALSQAIEKLINDGELRNKMGSEGRKEVVDKYSLTLSIADTDRLLSSIT